MAHTDVKAFEEELELLTKVIAILGDLLFFLFNRMFPNILITSFLYVIIDNMHVLFMIGCFIQHISKSSN
jgi:hypothetical protein